nr:uncharacterized protein LOC129438773 isoform X1 [Misgurnus anguillicaudatus]
MSRSHISQNFESILPEYQHISTVSVPRTSKYRAPLATSRTNLINIKLENNTLPDEPQMLKFGLLNIRSLTNKEPIVNEIINDQNLDALCLTETWLKADDYISLNESTPQDYYYKHEPRLKGRGGGVATIYNKIFKVNQKSELKFKSFELMLLHMEITDRNHKQLSFALATIYRPPGHHADFLKEIANFLSELVVTVDKALIVGDFNIHVDNSKDALGRAFMDVLNSLGIKQNVSGPTHTRKHTLDLILSLGLNINDIEISPQSDAVSDHYLVSYTVLLDRITQSTTSYRLARTIISTTKDSFISTIPDLSQMKHVADNCDDLDTLIENLNNVCSNTLDAVAPIRKKKIKEKPPAPWYDHHTAALKKAARKMERNYRSTKLEVWRAAWTDSVKHYRQAIKTARSTYLSTLIKENHNNPRFLFSTVAKLTRNKEQTETNSKLQHNSNDFMNFFSNKITAIRENIVTTQAAITLPISSLNTRLPYEHLDSFKPTTIDELSKLVTSSKSSSCILDPVPTKLLKEHLL